MAEDSDEPGMEDCDNSCRAGPSVEALNSTCYCLSLDQGALRQRLEADLGARGLSLAMVETHPHLFASLPVYVSRDRIEQMAHLIDAVETVIATPAFRDAALTRAPAIAQFDPRSHGGLLGYDFHLTDAGPKLIEINTNPGGVLLNAVLGLAQRACCADLAGLVMAPAEPASVEPAIFEVFMSEWRQQKSAAVLRFVAIVDEVPERQYLYPEFLLFQQMFERHGIEAIVCDPEELTRTEGRLWHRGQAIDFVYNRLTDFALELPAQAALKSAYLAREVVVSPHPRAHALYADKRNLSLLGDRAFLRSTGVTGDVIATLLAGIPHTELMSAENREALWANRRRLFFKPAVGYGSKAAYRGGKLTKRVWAEIGAGTYVAQELVAPSERHIADAENRSILKVDVRNYTYRGSVKLLAARLYQGQTTNLRTPGGGFAPVFTELLG